MAANVAFQAALTRLGFNDGARDALTDANRENVQIETLATMTDDDVETLCKSLRRPGGLIVGALPPGAAVGAVPPMVPNPGYHVSALAEKNLKTAVFIALHFSRTGRTLSAAFLDAARIAQYQAIKVAETEYVEPSASDIVKLLKADRVLTFIVNFAQQLQLFNGQGNRPLSYIIRDEVIPAEATDPTFGEPGSRYTSIREEIAARASHEGAAYAVDNARVFELLNTACGELELVKAWIKPYVRQRNGRLAWQNFKTHFRGDSEMEAIEVAAEKKLQTLVYKRDSPRYNFEGHVSMHRKAHNDLLEATGVAVTEQVKVRKLIASIQASNLSSALGTIRATPTLKNSFDEAVNFLKGYLSTADAEVPRNISKFESRASKKKGDDSKSGKTKSKGTSAANSSKGVDRWYTFAEYRAMSQKQKEQINQARDKRKAAEMSQVSSVTAEETNSISAVTSQRQLSNDALKQSK